MTELPVSTSIQAEIAQANSSGNVESALIKYLSYWYEILNSDDGPTEIIHNWRVRSSYFSGKTVRVTLPDGVLEGTSDGLEENGALRVKTADSSVTIIQAGDVERLREVGH